MENWVKIDDFENYSVSDEGRIRNDRSGRILILRETNELTVYVGLSKNGIQHNFSVAKLVARAFVYGETEIFDTPIHLDGKRRNNSASNLMWRPRWFARVYQRQFDYGSRYYIGKRLMNTTTGEIFDDSSDAVSHYGILEKDIALSIVNQICVWPTHYFFEVVKN